MARLGLGGGIALHCGACLCMREKNILMWLLGHALRHNPCMLTSHCYAMCLLLQSLSCTISNKSNICAASRWTSPH